MKDWTIIAPGPSLKLLTKEEFQPRGPVVAINNAILSGLPADFWALQDVPVRFEHTWVHLSLEERKNSPLIWCRDVNEARWRELGFRTWGHPDSEENFRAEYVHSAAKVCYTHLTLLTAIARAVALGARYISLYGVDMAGVGYSYGIDYINRIASHWPIRWIDEKKVFGIARQQWESVWKVKFSFVGVKGDESY